MNAAKQKLMNILEAAVKSPVLNDMSLEIAQAVNETEDLYLNQLMGFYKLQEELLRGTLSIALTTLDEIKLPEMQAFITSFITSYSSAVDARNNFTLGWFKSLIMSSEAKCVLARDIIRLADPHLGSAIPSHWTALARNDQSYMTAVMFSDDAR